MFSYDELVNLFPTLAGFNKSARSYHARLFRQILMDIEMNTYRWAILTERFVNDPRNGIDVRIHRRKHAAMSNLRRRLSHPGMSESSFAVAMNFLGPIKVEHIDNGVILTWAGGRKTKHTVPAILA
jgi:hypothetical protein